jgi:hypothetical protein
VMLTRISGVGGGTADPRDALRLLLSVSRR